MKVLVAGLLVILVLGLVVNATGHHLAALLIGQEGTLLWLGLVVGWIVMFDSRKRWPGASARERLANVLTFKR